MSPLERGLTGHPLVARLRDHAGPIVYRPAGGSLPAILADTIFRRALTRAGIATSGEGDLPTDALIVIGPGSDVGGDDPDRITAIAEAAATGCAVIAAPCGVSSTSRLLEELGENVHLFVRDPKSYLHLLKERSALGCTLAYDVLLACGPEIGELVHEAAALCPEDDEAARSAEASEARFFFRSQGQLPKRTVPPVAIDPETFVASFGIERAQAIVLRAIGATNELHTDYADYALIAAVLGKRVYLYENASRRMHALWMHSLHVAYRDTQYMP